MPKTNRKKQRLRERIAKLERERARLQGFMRLGRISDNVPWALERLGDEIAILEARLAPRSSSTPDAALRAQDCHPMLKHPVVALRFRVHRFKTLAAATERGCNDSYAQACEDLHHLEGEVPSAEHRRLRELLQRAAFIGLMSPRERRTTLAEHRRRHTAGRRLYYCYVHGPPKKRARVGRNRTPGSCTCWLCRNKHLFDRKGRLKEAA